MYITSSPEKWDRIDRGTGWIGFTLHMIGMGISFDNRGAAHHAHAASATIPDNSHDTSIL